MPSLQPKSFNASENIIPLYDNQLPLPTPPADINFDDVQFFTSLNKLDYKNSQISESDARDETEENIINNLNSCNKESTERVKSLLPKHMTLCSDMIHDELLETMKQRAQFIESDVINV